MEATKEVLIESKVESTEALDDQPQEEHKPEEENKEINVSHK
jgi:hypothetical protein